MGPMGIWWSWATGPVGIWWSQTIGPASTDPVMKLFLARNNVLEKVQNPLYPKCSRISSLRILSRLLRFNQLSFCPFVYLILFILYSVI